MSDLVSGSPHSALRTDPGAAATSKQGIRNKQHKYKYAHIAFPVIVESCLSNTAPPQSAGRLKRGRGKNYIWGPNDILLSMSEYIKRECLGRAYMTERYRIHRDTYININ